MQREASIFIGYRRQDSQGFAGRVADDLIDNFGAAQVFRDDDIPEGSDFTRVLEQELGRCNVLIAVIGPNWLRIKSDDNLPKLFHPNDWVRREIESALNRGIWILPVLVGNASMPSTDQLPDTLQPVAKIQAVSMSDRSWEHDLERLVSLLTQRIPALRRDSHGEQLQQENLEQGQAPLFQDLLASLLQTRSHSRAVKRTRMNRFVQGVKSMLVRALWSGAALLVGWYVFDYHATPELRQEVLDFMAFTKNKISLLIAWLRVE